ncbi:MAG: alcohol dehydrogenase catalytic domain-containing protein [Anaerolineae bacterium]|nr:alcohol dehydrogenase catalytic domain-containing protein [Anaerolineae bacterium]
MKALVYHGKEDLRLEERPIPSVGPGEVLLRVLRAGICGTDLRILHGAHRHYPSGVVRIPGHEVVGEIVTLGEGVSGWQVGQRVFVAPNTGCGHCRQCVSGNNNRCPDFCALGITIDGAFAEYVCIPAAALRQGNLIPLDKTVDPAAAVLIEPLACVLRGQDAVAVSAGDVVLIMGAGPIGILHTMLARVRGAARVIVSEVWGARLTLAAAVGADRTVDVNVEDLQQVVLSESDGAGADVVIVAAPVATAQQSALELAALGGRVNFFGGLPKDQSIVPIDTNLIHYKELLVTGTTACNTYDCWRAATLVRAGRIDLTCLVSGIYPLERFAEAFAAAQQRSALKIVFDPTQMQ